MLHAKPFREILMTRRGSGKTSVNSSIGIARTMGHRMKALAASCKPPWCLAVGLLAFSLEGSSALAIDDTSRVLARCEATLAYAANFFMLSNNESAARVMILHMARAGATNLFRNATDDRVPSDIAQEIREESRKVTPYLDANPSEIVNAISECQERVNDIYNQQNNEQETLFGLTLGEASLKMAQAARKALGLE